MTLPGSGITKAQALGTLSQFFTEVENALFQGSRVNIPLFSISPSVQGVFNNIDDRFDISRHKVSFNISKGERLKILADTVKPVKTKPKSANPIIYSVVDVKTQQNVLKLEANMILEVRGVRLRFPDEDQKAGLYLVDAARQEYSLRIISKESYAKVLIILPENLPKGSLSLKVVCKAAKHTQYLTAYCELYQ